MLPIIITSLIFLVCMVLILTERLNRTITALAGAVLITGVGLGAHFFTEEEAVAAIDFNTIGLLLGMMVLVALLEPTGFFQYLAVFVGKRSRGRPGVLFFMLTLVTTIVAMFLDNVTTVVLIAPVTVLICEILGFNPQPYLISEALLSNTGGVATLVGDPPNVLIGSAAHFSFLDFLTHSLPVILVVWVCAYFVLRWLFRKELSRISSNADALHELNPREALDEPKTARMVLLVIAGAVVFFFLQELLGVEPSFIALGAAAVALVLIRPPVAETFKHVQWDVLLFFTGLFIMIGGMEAAGVFDSLSVLITSLKNLPPVLLGIIVLWVVALLSAVVDNIPITIALIPIILGLSESGMAVSHLWWALAFGAGLGGNGTIIGSTANIVVVAVSEKTRHPIRATLWNKRGLPTMLLTVTVVTILYILVFPLFTT